MQHRQKNVGQVIIAPMINFVSDIRPYGFQAIAYLSIKSNIMILKLLDCQKLDNLSLHTRAFPARFYQSRVRYVLEYFQKMRDTL